MQQLHGRSGALKKCAHVVLMPLNDAYGRFFVAPTVPPPTTAAVSAALTSAVAPSTSSIVSSIVDPKSTNSKKRDFDEDDDDDSDGSASELLTKRLRPNFLNDVEQSMLLAQLENTASQNSSTKSEEEADSIVSSSGASAQDAETISSSGASKAIKKEAPVRMRTPSKSATITTVKKKSTATVQTTLHSPDPSKVQPSLRKATLESTKKHGRAPKSQENSSASGGKEAAKKAAQASSAAKKPVKAHWEAVEVKGTVPAERWGDSVTKISDSRVVVYGGADDDEATLGDLHVYDLKKQEWSRPLNCEGIPRAWHDAVFLESKNLLLVFGGERFMGGNQLDVLSDIMVLDTECFLWYPPAVSGVTPMARSGHTCTVVGNDIVVFGGSRGRNRQSSVHVLDSDTWHWKTVKIDGKPPSARTYHSAVAVGDSIVYFGGNDAKKSFNSVHVLKKKANSDTWTWFHPCVVGTPPQARTGHSATLIKGSKILIFGGWDPQREDEAVATSVFDDAFILNTDTWDWESVVVTNQDKVSGDSEDNTAVNLPGRVGHRAVVDADNRVFLFGGQNGLEKRLNAVHSIVLQRQEPEPETEQQAPTAL
ncbi:Rab9 effector protein, partial [Globisporangium splendens]